MGDGTPVTVEPETPFSTLSLDDRRVLGFQYSEIGKGKYQRKRDFGGLKWVYPNVVLHS